MHFTFALITICLILGLSTAQEQPNLKIRITKRGLDYVNEVASKILNDQIGHLKIPDVDQGDIKAWDMSITNFKPPAYAFTLTPPSTLGWGLNGADIGLQGKVRGCKKIITKICVTVDIKMNANGVNIHMAPKLGHRPEGHPTITGADVQISINKLDIEVSGGIVGWIVNLFRDKIASIVKKKAEDMISETAKKFLMNDANAKLATFPVQVKVGRFDLDYGLVADPAVTNDFIEVSLRGKASQPGVTAISPYPSTPLASNIPENKMVFVWVSDKVVNDMGYYAHVSNLTRRRIVDKDTPGIGEYLKLKCDIGKMCVGTIIPDLAKMYPDVEGVEMHLATGAPPVMQAKGTGSVTLTVNATMDLYVKLPNGTQKTIVFTEVLVAPEISIQVQNMKLVGQVKIAEMKLRVTQTQLDPKYTALLESGLPTLAKPIFESLINGYLAKGIQIPVTKGVEFVTPQIRLLERTVQVESDVKYTG